MRHFQRLSALVSLLICLGCGSSKGINPIALLTANEWELSAIQGIGSLESLYPAGLPSLYFLDGGKLSGYTGCNNFSGGFSLESGGIQLDPGAMTKKACPGSGEDDFLSAFARVKTYTVDKEKLTLSDGATELMSFIPKKD
ncbi:MAG: META domain-containing protein [Cyclobacteriaceae bacterium]|nr:META domain-containing protein [Cyclobacteriaceae bacterium]MDX5466594.1 META domain-containing protein [Cyclobacteriaceae bacterium]